MIGYISTLDLVNTVTIILLVKLW